MTGSRDQFESDHFVRASSNPESTNLINIPPSNAIQPQRPESNPPPGATPRPSTNRTPDTNSRIRGLVPGEGQDLTDR